MRPMLRQSRSSSYGRRETPYYAVSSIPLKRPPKITVNTVNNRSVIHRPPVKLTDGPQPVQSNHVPF